MARIRPHSNLEDDSEDGDSCQMFCSGISVFGMGCSTEVSMVKAVNVLIISIVISN